jgi:DNA-binding response OmpR family regulator
MPSPTRVLLVDDDETMLASMAAVLEDHFEIQTCSSPLAALRLLATETFDVVCMDWKMPEMDGIEFFRALEKQLGERMPSCVLITAHTAELLDQVSVDSRKLLGMLRKPFSPDELIARVGQFATIARMKISNTRLKAAVRGTG